MSKSKPALLEPLTEFELYKNQAGQIIINLVRQDKYRESINSLRQILNSEENRRCGLLIEFKVRSTDNKGNQDRTSFPTFYMRCSDLYVVGYKHEGNILIFGDDDLDYSPNIREYNFANIYTSSSISDSSLHAIGYVVAEAVRFPYIEKKISNLIDTNHYILNIDANLFDIGLLDSTDNTELNSIIKTINSILNKFTAYEITHGNWGFIKENGIKTKINKLFKKLDTYFGKLDEGAKEIGTISSTTVSKANDAVSEAKYFEELLSCEEDEDSKEEGNLEEVADNKVNLDERLAEIETELDDLHQKLQKTEDDRSEEYRQLWEDITEAQCEWAKISAMQKLALLIKNIQSIDLVSDHLLQVGATISGDAKIAINPSNSTLIQFSDGIYTEDRENHYSWTSERLSHHIALSYYDKPDDDKGGSAIRINEKSKENKITEEDSILLNYWWVLESSATE